MNEDLNAQANEQAIALRAREQSFSTLGRLTARATHKLRNPLATIQTSLYVVRKQIAQRETEPGVERALDRIARSVRHCDTILGDLRELSQFTTLEAQPVLLDDWLRELIDELRGGESVAVEFAPSLEEMSVLVDTESLRRAVINLYENAVQAVAEPNAESLGPEPPKIVIGTRLREDAVEIVVADNGPGMEPEVLAEIFEPFFSTKSFGVGLGLSVVSRVVELHGGRIDAESQPGDGARFVIQLPQGSAVGEGASTT